MSDDPSSVSMTAVLPPNPLAIVRAPHVLPDPLGPATSKRSLVADLFAFLI